MKSVLFKMETGYLNSTLNSLHPSHFTLHTIFFLLLTFFTIVPATHAGPLDDGLRAFKAGDYQRAHDLWKPLAQQGDPKAQYNLALLYENGWGAPKHLRTAMALYQAAAEQGYADAQYNLGLMFAEGKSVFKNRKRAAQWWEKASAQGHSNAMFNLGVLHAYGMGIKKDTKQALLLWEKAASLGHAKARQTLVRVYENGELGVAKNPEEAARWKQ